MQRLFGPSDVLRRPGFVAMSTTPLDGRDLASARRVLVTICGRCENTGMEFSKDRRTVKWRWGTSPVRVEPVAATLYWIGGQGKPKWRCQALRPDGAPGADVPIVERGEGRSPAFDADPKYGTMWYLLTRQ